MTDLVVVVPSRGRPGAARELADAFEETCTANTELVFAVDEDDATLQEYAALAAVPQGVGDGLIVRSYPRLTVGVVRDPCNMVHALNQVAVYLTIPPDGGPFAVGFMGDDHRPRTKGWDGDYLEALRRLGTGIVYGDDLLQRRSLPTQCAMTADIVRALGFMAPPTLTHLAVDNYWLELGTKAGCIKYLPDVVIEHRHPVAGKAQWDEGYLRVNAPEMYDRDLGEFARIQREDLPGDVEKVRALRSSVPAQ